MNRTSKHRITVLAACILFALNGSVMAQSQEQIELLNKEREAYFEEKLELTPAESKAFWPLYNDFNNRKIKIMEDLRNSFQYSHNNAGNLSDKEVEVTLAKILRLKSEDFELEHEYYGSKFPSVLPPKKVLMLYKVEWDFRRHLLREIRGRGHEGKGGPGGRGPGGAGGRGPGGNGPEGLIPGDGLAPGHSPGR